MHTSLVKSASSSTFLPSNALVQQAIAACNDALCKVYHYTLLNLQSSSELLLNSGINARQPVCKISEAGQRQLVNPLLNNAQDLLELLFFVLQ